TTALTTLSLHDALPISNFPAGRSLEFVATFSGAAFQHVGLADTLDAAPWAIFSTLNGGALFARTNSGFAAIDTPLAPSLVGSPRSEEHTSELQSPYDLV